MINRLFENCCYHQFIVTQIVFALYYQQFPLLYVCPLTPHPVCRSFIPAADIKKIAKELFHLLLFTSGEILNFNEQIKSVKKKA